jgi:hypothetical protein
MWEILDDYETKLKAVQAKGYAYFCGCNLDNLKKASPEMSKQDLTIKLARMWKDLSKREREEWTSSASELA